MTPHDPGLFWNAVSAAVPVILIFGIGALVDFKDLRAWWRDFRKAIR